MRLSFRLAAVKDLRKKKKKKNKVGGRRSNVKDDSKSPATCREIPEDILIEILLRLPADSLMSFKCVSKLWFSLISSKYFTDLFFKFSSSTMRGRRLFLYSYTEKYSHILLSSSLSNLDSTASFLQLNHHLNIPESGNRFYFVNALRGLVCFRVNRAILRIINLTTRQVLDVPCVKSKLFSESDDCFESNYFGYDPVKDEYKLLRIIRRRRKLRSETQVLVLGAGASWRNTKSLTSPQPQHSPFGEGIFINSVLYYIAWIHWTETVLVSFDFNSEEFNLIEFPIEITYKILRLNNLANYQDQVTVIDCSRLNTEYILDLWVLEDAGESKWSHKTFALPYHQLKLSLELDESDELIIKGTIRSGEVKLSGMYRGYKKSTHHALYDLEKNRITRGVVIELPFSIYFREAALWEDVENIMYLEA